jgi:prepilin signal peptidase PulO-like enzyme (type II secretory pathway)
LIQTLITIVASLALLVSAALIGVVAAEFLAQREPVLDDGPPRSDLHPVWALVLMLAIGVALLFRHATPLQYAVISLAAVPLIAAWYVDARTGIVPDWCTLAPLAVVLLVIIRTGHWVSLLSAAVIFIPFGVAAWLSKGRGMGWGDVKLATFCATLIGMTAALPAFAVACLAATGVAYRRDRGKTPIAFGPYLVVATFVALAITVNAR